MPALQTFHNPLTILLFPDTPSAVSNPEVKMKYTLLAALAMLASAQTQYTVSILSVPAPYLGGNVSTVNGGAPAGWAYANCTGRTDCAPSQAAMVWSGLNGFDVTSIFQTVMPAQIQAEQSTGWGGYDTEGGITHAILISPLKSGHTDLNGIFFGSKVLALCDSSQAGWAQIAPLSTSGSGAGGITFHAMLWFGDPNSWVDLHNEMDVSQVLGCDANVQVGYAASRSNAMHAVMWTGSRTSQIDLHSGPYQADQATAISGSTQVGWGSILDHNKNAFLHALLWHGAPNTLTDIHPAGFQNSQAFAAAGNKQVGTGTDTNGTFHGLLWFGTAASAIDLNQFLPAGYTDAQVDAIDPATGIIAGAAKGPKGVFEPAIWTPVAQ
jgi:hypothetical protein